ncbi:MAG: hypothetical protein ACI81F_001937, partial [Thalassolituus oleivorans]
MRVLFFLSKKSTDQSIGYKSGLSDNAQIVKTVWCVNAHA